MTDQDESLCHLRPLQLKDLLFHLTVYLQFKISIPNRIRLFLDGMQPIGKCHSKISANSSS